MVALDGALLPAEMPPLPNLPPNAEFITPPSCFEMGALGWILYSSGTVNVKSYKCVPFHGALGGEALPHMQRSGSLTLKQKLDSEQDRSVADSSFSIVFLPFEQNAPA